MKRLNQIFIASVIFSLILQACNLQLVESAESEGLLLTITANAQIIEQAGQPLQTEPPAQEQVVIVVTATPEEGAAPASAEQVVPAPVLPPAAGDVTVTVSVATNCRLGPGQNFASVYGMPVGQVAKVIAQNKYSGYWIIEIPGQNGQTCWLWGRYATVNGDTSTLTNVVTPTSAAPTKTNTPKPTATATHTPMPVVTKPNAPTLTTYSCTLSGPDANGAYTSTFQISWADNSNNEKGFTVGYPGGETNYPANMTTHQHTIDGKFELLGQVSVVAYNDAGISDAAFATLTCQ